jgi:hypothetical protein
VIPKLSTIGRCMSDMLTPPPCSRNLFLHGQLKTFGSVLGRCECSDKVQAMFSAIFISVSRHNPKCTRCGAYYKNVPWHEIR